MEKAMRRYNGTYLEAFILEDTFDGGIFSIWRDLGLEDYTKGTVANDLALGVLHLLCLAGQAILDLFTDDLCKHDVSISRLDLSCIPYPEPSG
jgi:hypothetical protein